jgi:hypothetical protein
MVTGEASMLTDNRVAELAHYLLPCDDVYRPRSIRSIVLNENEPATKSDLAKLADLMTRMASKDDLAAMASKDDLAAMASDLTMKMASKDDLAAMASKDDLAAVAAAAKNDLAAMEKRLLLEMGHIVNVVIEQIGAKVAVIDEKYDGPVREVRADLDAHRADFSLHTRPAPSPAKRTSRRKPLRPR